jgi:hypothetical protein
MTSEMDTKNGKAPLRVKERAGESGGSTPRRFAGSSSFFSIHS